MAESVCSFASQLFAGARSSRYQCAHAHHLHHRRRRGHVLRLLHARQHARRRPARLGHDALLIPTYTPIRTDEEDVSQKRVFFGGINVYLQQKLGLFRQTPWFLDRLLDAPRLLRWVSRFAVKTEAQDLGDLTISMLQGEHGHQRKEVAKLVRWLAADVKPEIINLTNALLSGMVHELKRQVGVPILCSLQGDDIFLESLPEPTKSRALELIREHCREIDGFIATSRYYADFMAGYFAIPRERSTSSIPA